MVPSPSLFHSLLRPAILQTLRATGFHAAKPAVVDALTELAARYMAALCTATAAYATHGSVVGVPTIVDVRMALEDVGALGPERALEEQRRWVQVRKRRRRRREEGKEDKQPEDRGEGGEGKEDKSPENRGEGGEGGEGGKESNDVDMKDLFGNSNGEPNGGAHEDHDSEGEEEVDEFEWEAIEDEDTRGVDDFLAWVTGPKFKEIKRVALDGEEDITDYLSALKKKHSKTGEDSKYHGTVLGKGNEHGDVVVEGGQDPSIQHWMEKMHGPKQENVVREPSPAPSSILSSVPDDVDMLM